MLERDLHALKTMLDHIEKVERFTRDHVDWESFFEDEESFDAAVLNVALIGEKTTKISAGFLKMNPQVEWRDIKSFRNFIVHNYHDLDPEKVWSILQINLPKLKNDLLEILQKV